MAIVDGQRVRALESNAAWMSKTANNTATGVQTFSSGISGPSIPDVQLKINQVSDDLVVAELDIDNLQADMLVAQSDIDILQLDMLAAEADIDQLQLDVDALEALNTFIYIGSWNASTNTPALADGDGGATVGPGAVYRVSVAGTQNLGSGAIVFSVNDRVVYNLSGVWEKWDTEDLVTSVNGLFGDVSLGLDELDDVTITAPVQRSFLQKGATDWEDTDPNELVTNNTLTGADQVLPAMEGFFKAVRFTNASLTSLEGIEYTYNQQKLVLINDTGSTIVVRDDSASTPAWGFLTGNVSGDLDLKDKQTMFVIYDSASLRWRVISGSGGGLVGYQEVPAGTINGVNTTFGPLTLVPSNDESIMVFIDGVLLESNEWTKVGQSIDLDIAPNFGQTIYVFYVTQGTLAPAPVLSGVLKTEYITLVAGDITAKEVSLAQAPIAPSDVLLDVVGGTAQVWSTDFTIAGSVLSWDGLVLEGILEAGDILRVHYVY